MPSGPADELYGLALEEFIPQRAARVKALRADKQREEAAAVAALRKPSTAAWAVNQLVRTQGKAITALFTAGDAIAKAQGSGKMDAMREASRGQRDAIDGLMEAARGLLSSDGHPLTAATLERVRETLRAASIDPSSRERVAGGCLTQELHFAGLGIEDLPVATPKPPTRKAAQVTPEPKADAQAAKRKRRAEDEQERAAARERKAALTAALKAETEARKAATRADKELAAATKRHAKAEAALKEADEQLSSATEWAEQTAKDLEEAERVLHDLQAG